MACNPWAPKLPSSYQGHNNPIFDFNKDNSDSFGFDVVFNNNLVTCKYPEGTSFTPVIYSAAKTYTCSLEIAATTSIQCPDMVNNAIQDGTYTMGYKNVPAWYGLAFINPKPTVFTFGSSPTPITDTVYATVTSTYYKTTTGSAGFTSTMNTPIYTKTDTISAASGKTIVLSTETRTEYVNSCTPLLSSKSSSPGSLLPSSSSPKVMVSSGSSTISPSSSSTKDIKTSATPSSSKVTKTPITSSSRSAKTSTVPSSSSEDTASSATPFSTDAVPSADPTAAGPSCPDGDEIITENGTFVVECYSDRDDHDMGPVSADNFEECVNICSKTADCFVVSYIAKGPCYLKSAPGDIRVNSAVWGARDVNYSPPSTSVKIPEPTTSTPSAPKGLCPDEDGENYYSNGKVFEIQCGIDRWGGDLPDNNPILDLGFEGCMDACAKIDECVDIALSGVACYLKGSVTTPVRNPDVYGAIVVGSYNDSEPTDDGMGKTKCPTGSETEFIGKCGSTYVIECASDSVGGDMDGNPRFTNSLHGCIELCDTTEGCVGLSWVKGKPGACYLKSVINSIQENFHVWGARKTKACDETNIRLPRKRALSECAIPNGNCKEYSGPDVTYEPFAKKATIARTSTNFKTLTQTATPEAAGTVTKFQTLSNPTTTIVYKPETVTSVNVIKTTVTTCSSVTSAVSMK